MSRDLLWSQRAWEDLQAIHDYLAAERPAALRNAMRAFLGAVEQLEAFPGSGPVALRLGDGREYRSLTAGNYRIYYRLVDEQVLVVRVRDARRDPDTLDLA